MKRAAWVGLAAFAAFGFATLGCGSGDGSGNGGSNTGGGSGGATIAAGAGGGSTSASGGSSSTSEACSTSNGTYEENTTFATAGATDPYQVNKWGTWGNSTLPVVAQTATGPSGLDCSAGCATLTIDFSNGTAQYSAGTIVEYFGTATDSVTNLLNETITAKIAVMVAQATGASTDVPISISLFGQDTYASTSGVDNLWVDDLGSASSLDVAAGWHSVTYQVVDAKVPSWSPSRTVCASGLHEIGIRIQNAAAIDASNGAVVTLFLQSVKVGP